MAQQTGSISFEAVGGFSSYASGQFTTTEDVAQMAQPNLTPWFSVSVDDTSYWAELHARNASSSNSEGLHGIWDGEDGWAHVTLDSRTSAGNDGSKNCYMNMCVAHPKIADKVTPSGKYTWLIEVKNLTWISSGSDDVLHVHPSVNNATMDVFSGTSTAITEDCTLWKVVVAKSDFSALTQDTRGYCYIPTGCYADFDLRVSLYEGEYEGPYKPYVDQSLITRVSTAETSIEQNAEAITLRAQEIERGMTFVPTRHDREDTWFWYSLPATQWTFLDDGWAHYEYTNAGTSEVSTYIAPMNWGQVIPGEEYTFLIEIKNYSGFSGTGQFMYMQEMAGAQFRGTTVVKANGNVKSTRISYDDIVDGAFTKRFVKLADTDHIGDGTTYDNMCFRYRMYIKPSTTLSIDVRISVYPGDYAGLYNEYLTATSSAQLKVANDEIDLRVEKSGVIAAINASTEAEGGSAVKIQADKVNIEGAAIFTSGRLSQSSLNAAYDAKGAASAVQDNLDNLAIGGTNLLGSTANPSSKAIVLGSAGTYTFGDIGNYNDNVSLYSFEDYDGHSNALKWTTSATGNRGCGWYTKVGAIKEGETYTFSCKVMSSVATSVHMHTAWRNGSATANYTGWTSEGSIAIAADEWTDYSFTFKPRSSAKLDWEFYVALCFSGNSGGATFRVAHAKLEKGNKATDWSPAPEDATAYVDSLTIGGRNLLLWTGSLKKGTNTTVNGKDGITAWGGALSLLTETDDGIKMAASNHAQECFAIPLATNGSVGNGEKVLLTFEARGNVTSVGQFYWIQASGANIAMTSWLNGSSTISLSETDWTKFTVDVSNNSANVRTCTKILLFYALGSANSGKWVELRKKSVKLEKGDRATDWTPAPEDIEASAVKRTQRIYYRTSSSTAPTSQYMPTAWVTETGDKWAANSTTVANWTAKATKLTNGGGTKYPYLFTCEQRQMGDGTLAYTTVLLDETTTVIDGGSIITNSIDANKLTVYDATIGKIKADAIDVSAIKIGDLDGASTVVSNAANGKSAYDRHTAYRGTCSTAAGTADKVVACTGFALATGATVEVYCSTANTANVPTLNVNSTGAKPIWINGAVASASNPCKWLAGDTVTFTYDGTRFRASLPVEGYLTEGTSNGLMVHRKSDATTGVQITDDVDIVRNGNVMTRVDENGMTLYDGSGTADGNVVASFGEDLIELGKGSEDAVIKLCDDTGQIRLNRLTSTNAWLEFVSNYWLSLSASKSSIGLGDDYVYPSSGGQIRYMGNVHLKSRNDDDSCAADIWMNGGGDTQTSSIDMQADEINLSGTVYADDINVSGTVHADGNIIVLGYLTLLNPLADTYIGSVSASKLDGTLDSARLPTVPVDKGGTGQTGVEKTTDIAAAMSAASGVTITTAQVATWGKVMQVLITAKATAAKSGTWTVGTMTAGHRPELVTFGTSNLAAIEQCRMGTDGAVSVAGTLAANASVSLTFTYLLA